jgi:hypothetical protein
MLGICSYLSKQIADAITNPVHKALLASHVSADAEYQLSCHYSAPENQEIFLCIIWKVIKHSKSIPLTMVPRKKFILPKKCFI